jgi:hypothetical protein
MKSMKIKSLIESIKVHNVCLQKYTINGINFNLIRKMTCILYVNVNNYEKLACRILHSFKLKFIPFIVYFCRQTLWTFILSINDGSVCHYNNIYNNTGTK